MTECKIVLNRYARLAGKESLSYDNVDILMGDDSDSEASKDGANNKTFLVSWDLCFIQNNNRFISNI